MNAMLRAKQWAPGLLVTLCSVQAPLARAEWTANVGYHNPVDATIGLNLLYFGKPWAFEVGLGWIDASTDKTTTKDKNSSSKTKTTGGSVAAAGDVDVKYLFGASKFRPYVQAGVGVGIGAGAGSSVGLGASAGGLFAGIGLMLGSPGFYGYGSYNGDKYGNTFAQGGLGVSL